MLKAPRVSSSCEEQTEREKRERERKGEREQDEKEARRVGIKFLKFPAMYAGKSHSASPRDI